MEEFNITKFKASQRFAIYLFLLVPFVSLLSPFSIYNKPSHLDVYVNLLCIFVFFLNYTFLVERKYLSIVVTYGLLSLLALFVPVVVYSEMPYLKLLYQLFYALCFALLKPKFKYYIFKKFTSILSIIFLLGIIEFFLSALGIRIILSEVMRDNGDVYFQLPFSLIPTLAMVTPAFRFMSICEEPGMVGTLCVFLLATINRKKSPFKYYVFFVSGILSLSLAFYVLGVLYFLLNFKEYKLKPTFIVVTLFTGLAIYTLFYENINQLIIQRVNVQNVEEIDNRSSYEEKRKFEELSQSSKLLWGMGPRGFLDWAERSGAYGAGAKKFILQNGLLALIIVFFSFSKIIIDLNGLNKKTLMLLILIWASFYQRHDWNFAPNIILFFTFSLEIKKHLENLEIRKNKLFRVNTDF